ncbi:MAG: helix-turn-helix domain-containing protein [Clostridia bacterium]|nr:helix-turn-helix domain-containing protein [Clostridia bacterium]
MTIRLNEIMKTLRHRDGRTQEELAQALGVTSQAVSRWEKGICCPDMELLPSIANYFGVSIDELFGYENRREQRVDELASRINEMNALNNGVDINIDECIMLARSAMLEFPENEKIMLSLASVLYNAGYVRYGEYHLIDDEGYNIYDAERHRTYAEWKEAILLYEKLLPTLPEGDMRQQAIRYLTQLYLNTGEHGRAAALVETLPDLYGSRDFIRINACDGKDHAEAYSAALLKTIRASAELMIGCVLTYESNLTPREKADGIENAIGLFEHVCPDGNYGIHHGYIARMYTLLSLYLWLDGRHDDAFAALDESLSQFQKCRACCKSDAAFYTSPLVRLVKINPPHSNDANVPHTAAYSLAEDWPWWSVQEYSLVRDEIQSDPRWAEWVAKTKAE